MPNRRAVPSLAFPLVLALLLVPVPFHQAAAGAALVPPPDDRAALLALHADVLAGHLAGDASRWLDDEGEDFVAGDRGRIFHPTKAERKKELASYLERTHFDSFVDLEPPEVRVSQDGTLGWVLSRIEGKGSTATESGEPQQVHFVSTWIELFEKHDGRWQRVGIVTSTAGR